MTPDPKIQITEIAPTELSGFCDVETGECVIPEADDRPDEETETDSFRDD